MSDLPTPHDREEIILDAMARGTSIECPTPHSRKEIYLKEIYESGGGSGGSGVTPEQVRQILAGNTDSALSTTSTNPVQNKVVTSALSDKVDKVDGKGLSTVDFTDTNYVHTDNNYDADAVAAVADVVNKVDKVEGKGLSTNDYDADAVAEVAKIVDKLDANKVVSSFSTTTLNTNVPSEKLVKTSLDAKADSTDVDDLAKNMMAENLLVYPYNDGVVSRTPGVTFTTEPDGTITINGTPSGVETYAITSLNQPIGNNEYTLSGVNVAPLENTVELEVTIVDEDGTLHKPTASMGCSVTFGKDEYPNAESYSISLVVRSIPGYDPTALVDVKVTPMLEYGKVAHAFQPCNSNRKAMSDDIQSLNEITLIDYLRVSEQPGVYSVNGTQISNNTQTHWKENAVTLTGKYNGDSAAATLKSFSVPKTGTYCLTFFANTSDHKCTNYDLFKQYVTALIYKGSNVVASLPGTSSEKYNMVKLDAGVTYTFRIKVSKGFSPTSDDVFRVYPHIFKEKVTYDVPIFTSTSAMHTNHIRLEDEIHYTYCYANNSINELSRRKLDRDSQTLDIPETGETDSVTCGGIDVSCDGEYFYIRPNSEDFIGILTIGVGDDEQEFVLVMLVKSLWYNVTYTILDWYGYDSSSFITPLMYDTPTDSWIEGSAVYFKDFTFGKRFTYYNNNESFPLKLKLKAYCADGDPVEDVYGSVNINGLELASF